MYQVFTMYGDNEPWWFFDGWGHDVDSKKEFTDFCEAFFYFEELDANFKKDYQHVKEKPDFLRAYWNEGDQRYCEECEEDLQQYKGLLLLKDNKKLSEQDKNQDETINYYRKAQCCKRLGKGTRCQSEDENLS